MHLISHLMNYECYLHVHVLPQVMVVLQTLEVELTDVAANKEEVEDAKDMTAECELYHQNWILRATHADTDEAMNLISSACIWYHFECEFQTVLLSLMTSFWAKSRFSKLLCKFVAAVDY